MPTVADVRARFPALARTDGGRPVSWLDGPGGTQVPRAVIDAITGTYERGVSNLGDHMPPGRESYAAIGDARHAIADLVGAEARQVVFGPNMTTLTFAFSRAFARTWRSGDNIVLSRLDHDANVAPWLRAADEADVEVRWIDIDATARLRLVDLPAVLDERTRLVAVTAASNAFGTVVDLADVARRAHEVGAVVFVDAVHRMPHGPIDVAGLDLDVVVCSAYKFFGPHVGALVGRTDLLAALPAYKVRPAPDAVPWRWETGTQNFPALRGVTAAVEHIASLSDRPTTDPRTDRLAAGYRWIAAHEAALGRRFLAGIDRLERVRLWGPPTTEDRGPTFALTVEGVAPTDVVRHLADRNVYAWAGHYYAVEPMRALGLLDEGGAVRIGFVHYNDETDVDRALEALAEL